MICARTTANVKWTQSARFLLSVKFNTQTRNNCNRYLKQISVKILLKQLDYSRAREKRERAKKPKKEVRERIETVTVRRLEQH